MATIKGKWRFYDTLERPAFEIDEHVNFEFRFTHWVGDEERAAIGKGDRIYTERVSSGDPQWSLRYNYTVYIDGESSEDPPVEAIAVYGGGNKNAWLYYVGEDIGYHIVDFGYTGQTVSDEFHEWFTANAVEVVEETTAATITYNGSIIASLFGGQTATLKCAGMKMESDVVVEVGEPSSGGSGGGDANIVPLTVAENGTFDENGPVIVTETFTGGTPDLVLNFWGTQLPYFKAKKLVATDAILGAFATGQISFTADGVVYPIAETDVMIDTNWNYASFNMSGAPVIVWLINPTSDFSEEAGFEPNSVYVLDVWSAGMLGEGATVSLTSLGVSDKPIDGYMPVEVAIPFEKLEITPKHYSKTYNGYYKEVFVNSVPVRHLTITPSAEEQTFSYQQDLNGTYLSESEYRWFEFVRVEAADLTKMQVLCDIELEKLPKTEYVLGEPLDITGGVILSHYTDGSVYRTNLTNRAVWGFDPNSVGTHKLIVQVTEGGITCRTFYDITVTE